MSFDFFANTFAITDGARPALIDAAGPVTWDDLQSEVKQKAAQLEALALPPGEPVLIFGPKNRQFVMAMLACVCRGNPYIPVDSSMPTQRVEKIRSIAGAQVLIDCTENGRGGMRMSARPAFTATTSEDPTVYIIFTSGSTGEPKGVQVTRRNVQDYIQWLVGEPAFPWHLGRQVFVNPSSFSFDLSVFDLLLSLQRGDTLILRSSDQLKAPSDFAKNVAPLKPTVWTSTPSMISLLLLQGDFSQTQAPGLKTFVFCGETLHGPVVQRIFDRFPDARVWNTYGPTEATVFTTQVEITRETLRTFASLPVGSVKPGTRIDLVGGEIVIVGANVASGYLHRPDLTAKQFFSEGGARGYRTGDQGLFQGRHAIFRRPPGQPNQDAWLPHRAG